MSREPKLLPPVNYFLTESEKNELMAIAKATVAAAVKGEPLPEPEVGSEKLRRIGAAFVTLKKHGQLRGCIGHIIGRIPLNQCVQKVAVSAALEDPRFRRVMPEELPELEYEISVLTPTEIVKDLDSIIYGYGLRGAGASAVREVDGGRFVQLESAGPPW